MLARRHALFNSIGLEQDHPGIPEWQCVHATAKFLAKTSRYTSKLRMWYLEFLCSGSQSEGQLLRTLCALARSFLEFVDMSCLSLVNRVVLPCPEVLQWTGLQAKIGAANYMVSGEHGPGKLFPHAGYLKSEGTELLSWRSLTKLSFAALAASTEGENLQQLAASRNVPERIVNDVTVGLDRRGDGASRAPASCERVRDCSDGHARSGGRRARHHTRKTVAGWANLSFAPLLCSSGSEAPEGRDKSGNTVHSCVTRGLMCARKMAFVLFPTPNVFSNL